MKVIICQTTIDIAFQLTNQFIDHSIYIFACSCSLNNNPSEDFHSVMITPKLVFRKDRSAMVIMMIIIIHHY